MSLTEINRCLENNKQVESRTDFPTDFRQMLSIANRSFGEQTAVNFFEQAEGVTLTFKELSAKVNQLADGLNQIGVSKGCHVAVMMTNRVEFPITWLAIAVLGAVMVPINVRYTSHELDYVIDDSDSDYIITEEALLPVFESMNEMPPQLTGNHIVVVDRAFVAHEINNTVVSNKDAQYSNSSYLGWTNIIQKGKSNYSPDWTISGDDLLNIQYTSGTTGFPKGCMQSQKYWILLGCSVDALLSYTIKNILTDHSFFYMDPQWQLVMALFNGARLNVAAKLSSSQFVSRVKKFDIDMAWFPRPLLSEPASPDDRKLPLKKLFIGGASAESINQLQTRFGINVSNAYGMTEIGPGLYVPDEITDPDILGTCGIMSPYRECKVMLENGKQAVANEAGELWVRGAGIFSGYYNNPEANADAFVNGWFRTGDKFIRTEKGYFKIVGRFKDMIRRSSENISALEVEHVLSQHPAIRQAAVIAVADDYRGEEVKAFILLRDSELKIDLQPDQIVEYCKTRLAEFKIPRYIDYVKELPLTPTQKVAKHILKERHQDFVVSSWDRTNQKVANEFIN